MIAANNVGKTIANLWFILTIMVLGERGLTPLEAPKKNKVRFAIVLQTAVLSHSRRFEFAIPPRRTWPPALQNFREGGTRVSFKIINAE